MSRKIGMFLFGLVLIALSCSKDDNPVDPGYAWETKSDIAQQVHALINNYRISKGLSTLAFNDTVAGTALQHSQNMAAGIVPFSHDGFNDRMSSIAKNLKFNSASENVAWNRGYEDPAQNAVNGWLGSADHQENIVGDFNITGIGVAVNEKGEYYFTQMFVKID